MKDCLADDTADKLNEIIGAITNIADMLQRVDITPSGSKFRGVNVMGDGLTLKETGYYVAFVTGWIESGTNWCNCGGRVASSVSVWLGDARTSSMICYFVGFQGETVSAGQGLLALTKLVFED